MDKKLEGSESVEFVDIKDAVHCLSQTLKHGYQEQLRALCQRFGLERTHKVHHDGKRYLFITLDDLAKSLTEKILQSAGKLRSELASAADRVICADEELAIQPVAASFQFKRICEAEELGSHPTKRQRHCADEELAIQPVAASVQFKRI